jgi:hypothetical protein
MINHLAEILNDFPGSANRTRCFTHILNLVAKCIMRQFDSPKAKAPDFEAVLEGLADDPDDSDAAGGMEDGDVEEEGKENDDEEIMNGQSGMKEEEIQALEEGVRPVKHVLLKVLFWQYYY